MASTWTADGEPDNKLAPIAGLNFETVPAEFVGSALQLPD
jgi:hypothetical protein